MSSRPEPYPVREVPAGAFREDEYLGTKFKFWFHDGAQRVLFKRGRRDEDWSEKVAAEVAALLALPAADVDLAVHEGRRGIVSPTFLAPGDQLFHGNELLLQVRPDYPQHDRYHVAQHTVDAVFDALGVAGAGPTPEWPPLFEGFEAPDQFVGYLMLDALVGNTDWHHENWAVVQRGAQRFLAPTYDHASSLGRNEPEHRLRLRVEGGDPRVTVESYVHKGKSAFYSEGEGARPLTTLEAFARAAALRPRAARAYAARLAALPAGAFDPVLLEVPDERISELHRRFAARILGCNRARVVNVVKALDEE